MNAGDFPLPPRPSRREALKWLIAASGAMLADVRFSPAAGRAAAGYGTDPNLLAAYAPGDLWPLTLTEAQRAATAALCDTILPGDEHGPGAAAVRVQDFIDEWISAPYPGHSDDRSLVLEGLAWLDREGRRRFGAEFARLPVVSRQALCDDICHLPDAKAEFRRAATFFQRFRDLAAGGYYTTPEGMKDIGYTGNVALEKFDGPTPEVRARLGLP